jgi:hypothetical protein
MAFAAAAAAAAVADLVDLVLIGDLGREGDEGDFGFFLRSELIIVLLLLYVYKSLKIDFFILNNS